MALRFQEWLVDQQLRTDPVGALARVPDMQNVDFKPTRQKPDEHRNWADIVVRSGEPGRIEVFNDAWQEFLLAKQAASRAEDGSPSDE